MTAANLHCLCLCHATAMLTADKDHVIFRHFNVEFLHKFDRFDIINRFNSVFFPHSLSLSAFSRHVFRSSCLTCIAACVPRVLLVCTWFSFFALGFIFLLSFFHCLPVLFCFFGVSLLWRLFFLSRPSVCPGRCIWFVFLLKHNSTAQVPLGDTTSCLVFLPGSKLTSHILSCIRNVVIAIYILMTGCISVKPFLHFNSKKTKKTSHYSNFT